MSFVKNECLNSCFNLYAFFLTDCVARIYRTMLNGNGEKRCSCFIVLSLSMMLSVDVFADALYQTEIYIPIVFVLGEGVEYCPTCFL